MNVAIFTVIRNEQDYLNDFLKYHTEMGLHIFVFEDLFSNSHSDICCKYDNVELHSIKELYDPEEYESLEFRRKKQLAMQSDFITRGLKYIHSLNIYDWCWVIDIDEYITSSESFPDILNRYTDYDAVRVYWMNYGCSGHIYKPIYDKPIYEIYTERCGYENQDFNLHNITKMCINMHRWNPKVTYRVHFTCIDWVKADMTFNQEEIVYEPLYLRHYITKSFEEYCHKIFVRGMMHNGHRKISSFFEMQPQYKKRISEYKLLHEHLNKTIGVDLNDYI